MRHFYSLIYSLVGKLMLPHIWVGKNCTNKIKYGICSLKILVWYIWKEAQITTLLENVELWLYYAQLLPTETPGQYYWSCFVGVPEPSTTSRLSSNRCSFVFSVGCVQSGKIKNKNIIFNLQYISVLWILSYQCASKSRRSNIFFLKYHNLIILPHIILFHSLFKFDLSWSSCDKESSL